MFSNIMLTAIYNHLVFIYSFIFLKWFVNTYFLFSVAFNRSDNKWVINQPMKNKTDFSAILCQHKVEKTVYRVTNDNFQLNKHLQLN